MIQTERLIIKPFTENDVAAFLDLSRDDVFNLFPITIYRQSSVESALEWIRKTIALNKETNLGKWAVWERSTNSLIGMGGLTPWKFGDENLIDITYRLRSSALGKGYGIELARALVQYGFNELNLPEITATITPDNEASKKVAEKIGLKFDQKIELLGVATDLYRLKRNS